MTDAAPDDRPALHGEYKVHGGKLVIADLGVRDGRLADVRISGDFFLEPDEALDDILAALTGLPADAPVETLAAAIRRGLRPEAALVGFSPEAVAIAVRRALGLARTWRDHEWRIIGEQPVTPPMQMALDEVLAREVAAGRRPPTLRWWGWERPAIVIGNFQSLSNEVDLAQAQAHGIEVVRRATGGGAMLVEPGATITYSLYAPDALVADMSLADSYAYLDQWVITALQGVGIDAEYKPLNDIASPKGKIGGAAQRRFAGGAVLHHVTMAYDMDGEKMARVLRIGREKISDKGIASAAKRVDPVRSQTGLPREQVIERLTASFVALHGGTPDALTPGELAAAETLAAEKYASDAWLRRIP
ncbi:biotin/lipoate A/B protein ligase family protein [Albimonas sp. CAU 1670]|uniref:lipoate--protein ligase family protein n=1 Tax=Albimonas sp. CAU 1670 TaxID=3032599 RepID=UPI0023DB3FED|nr:biotin/lipoate A/B protein ligase family protein [Albimonas sp. CAU 1670]MDF2234662.1 biotin/lipoate A/B protein ligase family protein [Albimonas sp. CAU 1670]